MDTKQNGRDISDISGCTTTAILKENEESHAKWLHEWLLKHPNAGNGGTNAQLNRSIIVAAVIIAVAIAVAAYILRPSGARFRSIGTDRIYDVQTGEVKFADPPETK